MRIVVFGTGFVGDALVREFADRGHEVSAVSRSGDTGLPAQVRHVTGNVYDHTFVQSVTSGADAIVSALPALGSHGGLGSAVTALLRAVQDSGARLGVVGGASIFPMVPGGTRRADSPGFPARFAPLAAAHQDALDNLNSAPGKVDWFYLVPAAEFGPQNPGTRTGSYRTSNTALVTDENGRSLLGVADYAIAFADELESPLARRAWLAVGY
jgi:putative NADH-flavin reductase